MSGGGTTQTTVQNKDPWGPSVPFLNQVMQTGQNLYNSNAGGQTWGGPLVASQSPDTMLGSNMLRNTSQQIQPQALNTYGYGQGLIQNNGLTSAYNSPLSTYGNVASGQNGITTGQNFADVASAAGNPTAATNYLTGIASGQERDNPYIQQMLAANDARLANRVNSTISGMGRYGSGGHTDLLARTLAESDNPVLAQAYDANQNRMISASNSIDAAQRAAQATQLSALTGQTGTQGQNIANQMQGAAGQTGILNYGQSNAANWAGMSPTLANAAYAPSQQELALGAMNQGYNQQQLDAQRQLYEQQQAMPWTQLNRFSGSVTGLGGLIGNAGTTTGNSQTQLQTPWTQYAGLGIAGLGLLSDRNEKTDIKKVGDDENTGLPLYSYRYKDDPKTYPKIVGPMAQDVQKKYPGLVGDIDGKLYIKPAAFGLLGDI